MNKQELTRLSKLFEEIVKYSRRDDVPMEAMENINLNERVKSNEFHRGVDAHEKSMLELAEKVDSEIENMEFDDDKKKREIKDSSDKLKQVLQKESDK